VKELQNFEKIMLLCTYFLTFTFLTTLLLATVFLEGGVLFFDGLPFTWFNDIC